jgi:hypothetical protein
VKKYREFQYAIIPIPGGWYQGIVFSPDGGERIYQSKNHRSEYNAYIDIANKIDEFHLQSKTWLK